MGNKKQRRADAAKAVAREQQVRSGIVFHALLRGIKRRMLDSRLTAEVDLRPIGRYKYEGNLAFISGNATAATLADFVQTVNQLYDLHASDAPRLALCHSCGVLIGMQRCARCRTAIYCDEDCQAAHWPAHKAGCCAAKKAAIDVD